MAIRTRLQELEQNEVDVRQRPARTAAAAQAAVRARLDVLTMVDPLPEPRERGHLYVTAVPTAAPPGALVSFLDENHAFAHLTSMIGHVIATRPGKDFEPQLSGASRWTCTDEGRAFTTVPPTAIAQGIYEPGMIHGLLSEDGTVTVICGRGTDRYPSQWGGATPRNVLIPALLLGTVHDVVGTAGRLADTRTAYQGEWQIGIRIDHLKGVTSSDYHDLPAAAPAFSGELYEEITPTTTAEMVGQPWAIAERLLRRLLRAVGSDKVHLPYRPTQGEPERRPGEPTAVEPIAAGWAERPDTLPLPRDDATTDQHQFDPHVAVETIKRLTTLLADRRRVLGPDHPDTVTSINNLADAYQAGGDLGRAVPLYEQALADRLANASRPEEALAATGEAVEAYRRLATARPDAFEPDLATALNNLGNQLSSLGRREEALAATSEAVEAYRRLATAHPDAFEPDLASALNNLSVDLSSLGRREEALAATSEAVDIRRRLAAARPDAFEPDLARSLWTFAWVRTAVQAELPQALASAEEAVTHYEALTTHTPLAFADDLAGALTTLADVLGGLDRAEDAAAARRRAAELGST
jgi:tetratricopeptide (TPR) repeat protein